MTTDRLLTTVLLIVAGCSCARAEDRPVDYLRDVKPILQEHCYACHGGLQQESGLRLDTAKSVLTGGESGPAIVAGNANKSLLIEAVSGSKDGWRMPPEGKPLTPQQIDILRRWITDGADAPDDEEPQRDPRQHWAFQPVVRPALPDSDRGGWQKNPIDRFIAAEHARRKLAVVGPARRETLLRRVSLDLIGLPPTRQQLHDFLADDSADAYERLVDRLLDSPAYGERWARHWMDVWRYADWSGEENNQVRSSPQFIWRWRDWIVESINADKGYDRMLVEMLAGDELAPQDQDVLRATGFLARNYYKFNRNVWLDDTVEHTAKAFLGLTFECAKCHDHKYDPVSQKNYYQMRAFFEPHDIRTDRLQDRPDAKDDGLVRVLDAQPDTPTYLFFRGDEKQPETDQPLSPFLPDILGGEIPIEPVAWKDADGKPLGSTGRRLALARWVASSTNPLTARVAVNHIWLRHFGAPLVSDVTDFGLRSRPPAFGGLLDWLTVDFIESDWSMKTLHRSIVTSSTYRLSSDPADLPSNGHGPQTSAADPDNHFLWRQKSRRLEAEVIRDSILHIAGTLDTSGGGPEIPLDQGETSLRRSMYFRHGHERQVLFLELFDGASVLDCYRRNSTVLPQQALALSNSMVARRHSRILAASLHQQAGSRDASDARFVEAAFEALLCRRPFAAERRSCAAFLKNHGRSSSGQPSERNPLPSRESLIHVLMNHNDFVTVR